LERKRNAGSGAIRALFELAYLDKKLSKTGTNGRQHARIHPKEITIVQIDKRD
jgi:hypothetical protein